MKFRLAQGWGVFRRAVLTVTIAAAAGFLAATSAGIWGLEDTARAAIFGCAVVAIAGYLSLLAWARPFSWKDVESSAVQMQLAVEDHVSTRLTPRRVRSALRVVLASAVFDLAGNTEAQLVVHRWTREDFDVRIIDRETSWSKPRVSLVQVKARPIPSTFRQLAAAMAREGADRGILVTASRRRLQPGPLELLLHKGSDFWTTEKNRITLISIDDLDLVMRDGDPVVELFTDIEPPMRLSSIMVEH